MKYPGEGENIAMPRLAAVAIIIPLKRKEV
jgi:hypothetical protein